MAGSLEEFQSPKLSDIKALAFEAFNQFRIQRMNQMEGFRKRQLIEHQKILDPSGKKNLEQSLENNKEAVVEHGIKSDIPNRNLSGSDTTLQDSSLTGHFLRCFSDSSFDSSNLYRNKDESISADSSIPNGEFNSSSDILLNKNQDVSADAVNLPSKMSKQPFLRKRSGLLRYMSKPKTCIVKSNKPTKPQDSDSELRTSLKFKPVIQCNKAPGRKVHHVQFSENMLLYQNENSNPKEELCTEPTSAVVHVNKQFEEARDHVVESCTSIESQNLKDKVSICSESLDMENKELAEFEMLENCAQNSSFNSDSSVVQRVLQGESVQVSHQDRYSTPSVYPISHIDGLERLTQRQIPIKSDKMNLDKCLKEVQTRQQNIQNIISDFDPSLASLQKEISNSNKNACEEKSDCINERCSTPVEQNNYVNTVLLPETSDEDSSRESSTNSVIFTSVNNPAITIKEFISKTDKGVLLTHESAKEMDDFLEKSTRCNPPRLLDELGNASVTKVKLKEKMEELEKEIQIYQSLNSQLEKEKQLYETRNSELEHICKERDQNLKELQKARDEVEKHKEEEKKKFDLELENERRQFKREKETFHRYQKLSKDNPTRKEREELSVLRQEVEKLQEELKRQRIKSTNDNRRCKNQLIAIEKERDSLKLENITLEEQCQDLLATLKNRNLKKKHTPQGKISNGTVKKFASKAVNTDGDFHETLPPKETALLKSVDKVMDNESEANCTKPRVRFNLVPEFENELEKTLQNNLLNGDSIVNLHGESIEINKVFNDQFSVDVVKGLEEQEIQYEEIKHDDKIERIYCSGEREIIFHDGVVKRISADKMEKTLFPNGDVKEIFLDGMEVHRFTTGVVEKHFPSGEEITEFPNGQIHRIMPGVKEVQFPDGSTHRFYSDGSEEVLEADETQVKIYPDGTQIIDFKNGERLIRTAELKRREFPDGSVKIIHASGRQETRFSNGRIRIKDKDGNLVVDTKHLKGITGLV